MLELKVGDIIIYPCPNLKDVRSKSPLKQFTIISEYKCHYSLRDGRGFRSSLQKNIVDLKTIVFVVRDDKIMLDKGVSLDGGDN